MTMPLPSRDAATLACMQVLWLPALLEDAVPSRSHVAAQRLRDLLAFVLERMPGAASARVKQKKGF